MCSIAGVINYNQEAVTKMTMTMFRRGPDYNSEMKNDNVIFGHNLLSVIGYQPQPVKSDRYMMVFNGCIYNYKELYPNESSDTIAILNSFDDKGIKDTLDSLNGMFAIGLYDTVLKKLHLIVDRLAQKPIYYYQEGDKFAFASTPSALLQFKDKWQIDRDALQSYWLLGSTMGECSIWQGIKKVCASEWLTLDLQSNEITIQRYWWPMYQDNAIDHIESLVLDAINKVKISDVPVHIFLSGGIDSTLVASQCQNIDAIHLDSPEKEYAELVSQRFGIKLKTISPIDVDAEECLIDYSRQCGEPSMAALIPYITAKETAKNGKVAIIANGADELFFGYDRINQKVTKKQCFHIMRSLMTDRQYHDFIYPLTEKHNYEDERLSSGRWFELMTFVQYDLNKTLDFTSGCHGLEVRSPFLDHRLIECALSIREDIHRKNGNKTILKNMLRKMGFNDKFLNRPKQGFSLHYKPNNMDNLIKQAWDWCIANKWLVLPPTQLSGRDQKYLEMSCLGFYYFYKTWEYKMEQTKEFSILAMDQEDFPT